jgi:hypothetical protein
MAYGSDNNFFVVTKGCEDIKGCDFFLAAEDYEDKRVKPKP